MTFSMNTEQDPDLQAEEDLQEEGELETPLVVKMVSACVAQVESRTCAHGETCEKCGSTDPVQDIVIMSENVEGENLLILSRRSPVQGCIYVGYFTLFKH